MSEHDDPFLRRAIALAVESARGTGGPFGAVVVHEGRILSEGANGVVAGCDPTAHAEVVAIRAAARALGRHDLAGCTLYSSCEPCPMCLGAAHWARVSRLVYAADRDDAARAGFDDALLYRQLALHPDRRVLETVQHLSVEGREPFDVWDSNPARHPY